MSILKPVYLMAGGRGGNSRSTSLIMQSVFRDTGKDKPVIAYVGVASGDDRSFYLMISKMLRSAGDCRVDRIALAAKNADLNKARDGLQSADAIFMSGGDVEEGMQVLAEKDLIGFFQGLHRGGGLFFGASAGSIMLAKEWVRWRDPDDDATAEIFPCLDIAPVICDTHAEEDDWEELQAALQLRQTGAAGYGIPSGSCLKVHPDGSLEALGGSVFRYLNRDGGIFKMEEIFPLMALDK